MRNLELIKFTEIKQERQRWPSDAKNFILGEVVINPQSIAIIRKAQYLKQKILSSKEWPDGLDDRIEFTAVHLNSSHARDNPVVYIIGDMESILKKLGGYHE